MWDRIASFLAENPLLLLFLVAGIGYPLGRLRIAGCSLGIAAVLFVGLALGALHPSFQLPEFVYLLGLTIFVYTVGLSSGPSFFRSLDRRGLAANLLVLGVLGTAAVFTALVTKALGIGSASAAGMFTGSLTNTPALAAVLEMIKSSAEATDPVIGYSITYPVGVLGPILAIWLWRAARSRQEAEEEETTPRLVLTAVRIVRPEVLGKSIPEIVATYDCQVVFGRLLRGKKAMVATGEHRLEEGDLLSIVGTESEAERVIELLGEAAPTEFLTDRSHIDSQHVFVSSRETAGKRLSELELPFRMNAIVTRIRRGDVEFLPSADTVLQLGDRVRVLTERENLPAVTRFFGDSYRAVSEVDILPFGLGLALGLLVGSVPIPIGGGITFKLGLAGGPLLVALVLSALHRTGPIVWQIPYSANLTLRQIGLVMFLAAVGIRSGGAFFETLSRGEGWMLFLLGAALTLLTASTFLLLASLLLRPSSATLYGMLAAVHTQPAVLAFAQEHVKSDRPNVGYVTVYAAATLTKIVLAQLLAVLLR